MFWTQKLSEDKDNQEVHVIDLYICGTALQFCQFDNYGFQTRIAIRIIVIIVILKLSGPVASFYVIFYEKIYQRPTIHSLAVRFKSTQT